MEEIESLTGDPKTHDVGKLAVYLSGSCLCGSVKVTIQDSDLFSRDRGHICDFFDCPKVSRSFAAANLIIEADKVKIDDRDKTLTQYV